MPPLPFAEVSESSVLNGEEIDAGVREQTNAHVLRCFRPVELDLPLLNPSITFSQHIMELRFTALFMAIVSGIASITNFSLIYFPELGALSYEVFKNPSGKWAKHKWQLALVPMLTGIVGAACAIYLPYGFASMILSVGLSIAILIVLRSPIAPAISAGFFPVVLGVDTWWYPVAILGGTSSLALTRYAMDQVQPPAPLTFDHSEVEPTDDQRNSAPHVGSAIVRLLVFGLLTMAIANLFDNKLILFPPLIVIAFELFLHPIDCPWSTSLWKLPTTCLATATIGVLAVALLGPGVISTAITVVLGIVSLKVIRLHIPPAIAVGLIPQILEGPIHWYPLSVGVGTSILVAYELASSAMFRIYLNKTRVQFDSPH